MLQGEWNWKHLPRYIDIQEVIDHPYQSWDKDGLSSNKGITIEITISLIKDIYMNCNIYTIQR